MPYIAAIDGLRAIAILMVISSHLGAGRIVPGGFGVTLFFFISGYLITSLMIREHAALDRLDVRNFYVRRFLRLVPALLVMLIVVSVVFAAIGSPIGRGPTAAAALYFENYYVLLNPGPGTPFGPMWSLAVEEHYYLVFPWLFLWRWRSPNRFLLLLGAMIIMVLAWRCILVFGLNASFDRTYIASDTRIDSILFGAVLAVMLPIHRTAVQKSLSWAFPLGLSLLLASFLIRSEGFRETMRYTLQGLALLPLFYGVACSDRFSPVTAFLSHPVMRWLGAVSYSLYLWHFPVLMFTEHFGLHGALFIFANIAADIALAAASYHLLETPFLLLRKNFKPREISMDQRLWHKCATPFIPRRTIDDGWTGRGQTWRRYFEGKWQYRGDKKTPDRESPDDFYARQW